MSTRFALILLLWLTACTPRLIPAPSPTRIALSTPSPEKIKPSHIPTQGDTPNMAPIPSTPVAPGLQSLIEKAKEDLAHRLSIPTTQINVLDTRDVTWSNSSLGCPQPGMVYADVITPGYLLLLNANGQDYEYHAGKSSEFFYCENPTPPVPGMSGDV